MLLALFDAFYVRPPQSTPTHFHKTLYLDPSFSPQEKAIIAEVAKEWTENTNHIAEFDIAQLPSNKVDLVNGILVLRVSHRYPEIVLLNALLPEGNEMLGLFNNRKIVPRLELIMDRTGDDTDVVALHELGHAVGLGHNEKPFTLMYPMIEMGSNHITDEDLEEFCKLYRCQLNN